MARSTLVVGAHLRVYVNGQPYGRTIEGEFSILTPQKELHVLDTFVPAELVQQAASVQGSIRVYKQHGDGGAQAAGIGPSLADLSLAKYFSILVLDRVTDTVVFRADRCSLEQERWGLPTRGYVTGQFSFKALNYSNETVSKTPTGS